MEWILIITFATSQFNSSRGITALAVPSFKTEQECKEAGANSVGLASDIKYTCVKRSK